MDLRFDKFADGDGDHCRCRKRHAGICKHTRKNRDNKHQDDRNNSDSNAKMLVLVAPGGMEAMFKETGRPVTNPNESIPPIDDDEKRRIIAAAPKCGIELQPPH